MYKRTVSLFDFSSTRYMLLETNDKAKKLAT